MDSILEHICYIYLGILSFQCSEDQERKEKNDGNLPSSPFSIFAVTAVLLATVATSWLPLRLLAEDNSRESLPLGYMYLTARQSSD